MYDPQLGRWHIIDAFSEMYDNQSPYGYCGNDPISFVDPYRNFTTKFGAWLWSVFNGGGDISQDKGGEYFVSQNVEYTGVKPGVAVSRTFDCHGRNQGKDLELEAQREFLLTQYEFKNEMEGMGIEVKYTDNINVARMGMLQIPAMVLLPNVYKSATNVTNSVKPVTRIKVNSVKELKALVNRLSKPGSKLSQNELNQLKEVAKQQGAKVKVDASGVKGTGVNNHAHIEGLGKSVESKHIWLEDGAN